MALSEGEQRRLEEMERALERDDPRFAASVSVERVRRCRLITGGAVFLLGAFVLLAGLVATAGSTPVGVVIGVAGFLIMVAARGDAALSRLGAAAAAPRRVGPDPRRGRCSRRCRGLTSGPPVGRICVG